MPSFQKSLIVEQFKENYLNLGEKIKIYPHDQVLTFLMTPQIWLFHVAVWLTKAKEWTKLLSLPTNYANL